MPNILKITLRETGKPPKVSTWWENFKLDKTKSFRYWIIYIVEKLYPRACRANLVMWAEFPTQHHFYELQMDLLADANGCGYCGHCGCLE